MITDFQLINWGISICAFVISLVSLVTILAGRWTKQSGFMLGVVFCNLVRALACFYQLWAENMAAEGQTTALLAGFYAAIFLKYILSNTCIYLFVMYAIKSMDRNIHVERVLMAERILFYSYVVLLVLNIPFGFIYSIDAVGVSTLHSFSFIEGVLPLMLSGLAMYLLIRFHESVSNVELTFYAIIGCALLAGLLLVIFWKTIFWGEMALTLAVFLVVFYVQAIGLEHYYEVSKEVADTEYSLLVSQLRPHFLYNVLSSISQLCKMDPDKAIEMTDRFSDYLVTNLKDMRTCEIVPFKRELAHIKDYISIEQIRFGDDLTVEFHIEDDDFSIPSMTIQPIVENAIKHGVGVKEEGGTISITTRAYSGGHLIIIHDDGAGFDMEEAEKKEKKHSGIKNARKRLKLIPGAAIMVHSKVGAGTTATIMLPGNGEGEES